MPLNASDGPYLAIQFFKENQYFTNTVLRKEYKFSPPANTEEDKPDENGITDAMLHFDWSEHVKPSVSAGFPSPERYLPPGLVYED